MNEKTKPNEFDDVLKRMLGTPPDPRTAEPAKPKAKKATAKKPKAPKT